MNGGISQMARVFASLDAEPIADRFVRDMDALTDRIDAYAASHRADMIERERERVNIIARFGLPDCSFVKGPPR